MNSLINIIAMGLAMSTPLILGTLGGLFTYKAGVLNIAIEGMMTTGAFVSIIVAYFTRNVWLGIIAAILMTQIVGLLFSLFSVTAKGHNVITGLGINYAVAAIAPFICKYTVGNRTSIIASDFIVPSEIAMDLPVIRNIPVLGGIFNRQTPLTYFALIAIFLMTVVLYKTKFGVYTQVAGENAEAAESVGINVSKVRYGAVAMSAFLSALAGINLSVENLGMYTDNMVSGRGFTCMAAIYCGKGKPAKCVAYALVFGLTRALQIKLTTMFDAATASLIEMLPYLMIVIVMFISSLGTYRTNNVRGYKNG